MSYDVRWCVETVVANNEGEHYAVVHTPEYDSPTYNLSRMFRECMGWDFKQSEVGEDGVRRSCYYPMPEVLPKLRRGLRELNERPDYYRRLEPENKWGTVESAVTCIKSWLDELDPESWDGPLYYWPLDALWWRW